MSRVASHDAHIANNPKGNGMESFETLVGSLLEKDGYWVRTSVKVDLTKGEKKIIGRPSSPRWELDLVAYKAKSNELLVVECKSYLDSPGVRLRGVDGSNQNDARRYKLFNDQILRKTVFTRLVRQLVSSGSCMPSPSITLCLAAGKVATERDREGIKLLFARKGWRLFDDSWLKERLLSVSNSGYENEVVSVVAKLLLREKLRAAKPKKD